MALKIGISLALSEFIGFFGYIFLSNFRENIDIKYIFLAIPLLAAIRIIWTIAKFFSTTKIINTSLCVAVILTGLFQLAGFTVYPGLVKDIDFLSLDSALNIAKMLSLISLFHMTIFGLAKLLRQQIEGY